MLLRRQAEPNVTAGTDETGRTGPLGADNNNNINGGRARHRAFSLFSNYRYPYGGQ